MATQVLRGTQFEPSNTLEQEAKALSTSIPATVDTASDDESSTPQDSEQSSPKSASSVQSDAEIEALVKRIHENVVIRDVPIKAAQWVQVPKGYLMDMELQPLHFLKVRAEARSEAKKRKRGPNLPKSTRKGWQNRIHGFRPEEVNWNGAVGIENGQPSNLTNKIHPLFDRSCFDDTPDAIYDQLVPALQLATLFLTQPICMQFWVTLAMGERKEDTEMSARNGRLSQRIEKHVVLTAERARTVINHLNHVGKSKLIHYRFNRGLQTLDNSDFKGSAYAVSLPICDYQGIDTEAHGITASLVRSIIKLNADYYVVAKKLSLLKFQEPSQKLRFSFGFGVMIVHELAHSIEGIHFRNRHHQWLDWQSSRYYKEPYWLDWQESECGRAWEQTVFGGTVQPINRKVDASHGLSISDWPFPDGDEDPQSCRWYTVSMNYIEHMFQMSTWQRKFDLSDWGIFNVPRDGATSLYINSFSTMAPSEEERVAKEEMAELVARSEEEPATKKRVTALGKTEERRPDEKAVIQQAVIDQEQAIAKPSLKRRVPMFPGTRRLSSVMPGPLPDTDGGFNVTYRPRLIPHIRKTSSGAPKPVMDQDKAEDPAEPDSSATVGISPLAPVDLERRRREFLEGQLRKELERGLRDDAAEKKLVVPVSKDTASTSEPMKKVKARPKGILEKYKKRRKSQVTRKLALVARRQEAADEEESKTKNELTSPTDAQESAEAKDLEPKQDLLETLDQPDNEQVETTETGTSDKAEKQGVIECIEEAEDRE